MKGALPVSPTIVLDNLEKREIWTPLDVRLLGTENYFPKVNYCLVINYLHGKLYSKNIYPCVHTILSAKVSMTSH